MNYAYFDTSALIKRYVEESRRRGVPELLRKNRCVISGVLPVEARRALRRRVGDRTLDAKRLPGILKRFAADRPYWTVILRALDSIDVASAKLFGDRTASQAFTFVSADARQTTVAEALGLETHFVGW